IPPADCLRPTDRCGDSPLREPSWLRPCSADGAEASAGSTQRRPPAASQFAFRVRLVLQGLSWMRESAPWMRKKPPWMREMAPWMRIAPEFLIHGQAADGTDVLTHLMPMDESSCESTAAHDLSMPIRGAVDVACEAHAPMDALVRRCTGHP